MTLIKAERRLASIILLSCFALVLSSIITSQSAFGATVAGGKALPATDPGRTSIDVMADQYLRQYPEAAWLRQSDMRDGNNNPIAGYVNPATVAGAGPLGTLYPPTPSSLMGWKTESKLYEGMYLAGLKQLGGFNGQVNSDLKSYSQELQAGDFMARTLQYPPNVANQAKAQALGQAQAMSNAMGDIAKAQSASAISYCSGFMQNFTVEEGNKWNQIRNGLFIPIAILLLLPGAILTQVKAMAATGNPVLAGQLGQMYPFEGILRSVVAIFLIPATYLVVNYGIDFSNSIINSIAGTYESVMGRNMYEDALNSEVRAFPVRTPNENQNAGGPQAWPSTPIKSVQDFENNYIANKVEDPSDKIYNVPKNKTDEAMPAGAVAARQLSFGANAALTAGWNILCAFQMAYLSYLFLVGPVVAALWVWPIAQFRQALPNWIEGVVTLCFWSLFWNTAILLMACFKGVDDSGTIITSALNFLATASVKFAFDFAGLVRAAGQEAAQKSTGTAGNNGQAKASAQGKAGSNGAVGIQGNAGVGGTAGMLGIGGANGAYGGNGGTISPAPRAVESGRDALLANTIAPAFSGQGQLQSPSNLVLPPMALSSKQRGPNGIYSPSLRSGNYSISPGIDEHGVPVDLLKGGNGHVVAELPRDVFDGQPVSGKGVTATAHRNVFGSSFYLTGGAAKTYTADDPSLNNNSPSLVNALAIPGNPGSPATKGDANHAPLTLKSSEGLMLLDPGGNALLIPRADGSGYHSLGFDQSASGGIFTLADGRILSLSRNRLGSHQVSIANHETGQRESFAITADGSGAFDVQHCVDGTAAGSIKVSRDGESTVYSNYDSLGRITDTDKISANNIATTVFDPEKGHVLGYVVSDYEADGSSKTNYYRPDKSLIATSEQLLKADGGYVDTVRDSTGRAVSVQQKTPDTTGGYALQSYKYQDGQLLPSQISTFDANANLVCQAPIDLSRPATNSDSTGLTDASTNSIAHAQRLDQDDVSICARYSNTDLFFNVEPMAQAQWLSSISNVHADTEPADQANVKTSSHSDPELARLMNMHPGDVSKAASIGLTDASTNSIAHAQGLEHDDVLMCARYSNSDLFFNVEPMAQAHLSTAMYSNSNVLADMEPVNQANVKTSSHSDPELARLMNTSPGCMSKDALDGAIGKEHDAYKNMSSMEEIAGPGDQSLQEQLMAANNHSRQRQRTIGEILKGTTPCAATSDALSNAYVNYSVLCSLFGRGMFDQAQQLVKIMDRDMQMLSRSPEAMPLIESYIELLKRHRLLNQDETFENGLERVPNLHVW